MVDAPILASGAAHWRRTAANVGQWQTVSQIFTLPAGPQLLSLVAMGTPGGQPPIAFMDDLSVIAVPEPASLAIIGIGLLGSVALRKVRRAKSEKV